jgi:UDP-N-acetylmuramate-alanine ligase
MNIHCIGANDIRLNYIAKFLQGENNITCSYPYGSNIKNDLIGVSFLEYSKNNIANAIDRVIVAPHVTEDNIEIQEAIKMGIPIASSLSWLREYAEHKQRIVVLGNEAHNICTLAILVLKNLNIAIDYALYHNEVMVLAPVNLSDNPIILIEASMAISSQIDSRLDCLIYEHHLGVISNDESLYTNNRKVLEDFVNATPKGGYLFFSQKNQIAKEVCASMSTDARCINFCDSDYARSSDKKHILLSRGRVLSCTTIMNEHSVGIVKSLLCSNFAISEEEYYEGLLCVGKDLAM